jgi:L-alanine-DL-glutamate epimerase-like enolase superfamily enzyme
MALIKAVETGFYRIPLTVSLSDSTHGKIDTFQLITCRVRDSDGAEGVGYTYTVGRNGGAIADALRWEIPELIQGREADDTEAIWQHVWWALHYGGRGGPPVLALSALDIALWDLKARRASVPLFRLLGGFDARVPCYAGGIDLDLSVEALLQQTDDNLAKGFHAIKMKVGRPDLASDITRVQAMRKHLGNGFPLMADANMKWTVEEAIRAARALQPYDLLKSQSFLTMFLVTPASWPPAACRSPRAKTCALSGSSRTILRLARCRIQNPMSPIAGASPPS